LTTQIEQNEVDSEVPMTVPDAVLSLKNVSKRFGSIDAVKDVSLEISPGEVVTLFGPRSGGMTTLLRAVAGLERLTAGDISYGGQVLDAGPSSTYVSPQKRNMGVVLRPHGLWPHMTVAENVAYPLRVRKVHSAEIRDRVAKTLEMVGVGGFEQRAIASLTGGEQLRTAVARGLASAPSILLIDEPMADLEPEERDAMRFDLRIMQRALGVTMLLATHDRTTALALSDRIAVVDDGRLEQVGEPAELYRNPTSGRVRDLLGSMVLLDGVVEATPASGLLTVRLGGPAGPAIDAVATAGVGMPLGAPCHLAIRPEGVSPVSIGLTASAHEPNVLQGIIATMLFAGDRYEARIELPWGQELLLQLPPDEQWRAGQTLSLRLSSDMLRVWPSEGTVAPSNS